MIESLESRCLLAAVINGTNGDDTFVITVGDNNAISLIFNGVPEPVNPPSDGNVEVHGAGGNDTISLLNTGTLTFFLFGEQGNDHFNVGNGNLKSDVHRDVLIIEPAGAGNDTCAINDLFGGGTAYYTDDDSVGFIAIGAHDIVLPSMVDPGDGATVLGSDGDDTLVCRGMPRRTSIELGTGHDSVNLGGGESIVAPDLPDTSAINGGGGQDTVMVDDSNPASTRTSIRFDDSGMVDGPDLDNFNQLNIKTHQLPGLAPEPVTFRGGACITPFVSIIGGAGDDLVQIGEPGNGVFARLYADHFVLELDGGGNRVELNEQPTLASNNWRFVDSQLENVSGGPMSLSTTGFEQPIELHLNGTNQNDTYTVVDAPDTWYIHIDGLGGDDRLEMGGALDLDDVFDCRQFEFIGGAGIDTMALSDVSDQTGDADEFFIGDLIRKRDFGTALYTTVVEHNFVDNLTLQLDNDPNRVFFDVNGLTYAEIAGNGGNDTFFNQDELVSPGNRLDLTLAATVILRGGSGNDILSLDDTAGSASNYSLGDSVFSQTIGGFTRNLAFDSFTTVEITGADTANFASLARRPTGATLNFNAGGGDDTVLVGGGDLDSSGLMASDVTISGGTGVDDITFYDLLDTDAVGETETYTMGHLTLSKGTPMIIYSSFESQTLIVAEGIVPGQINTVPTVNINSVSGFLDSTTIDGGSRGCVVNVGNNLLDSISGTLTLNLEGGAIIFNDQNATAAQTYDLSATAMTSPLPVTFSGATSITLNASSFNDRINIDGVAAGTTVSASGRGGNDIMSLGGGDFGNILGPVTFNGNIGDDFIRFSNFNDTDPFVAMLRSDRLVSGGITHPYSGFEILDMRSGPGGSDVIIDSIPLMIPPAAPSVFNFSGGSGPDQVTIGTDNVLVGGNITVSGGSGGDTLILDDTGGSSAAIYTFDQGNRFFKTSGLNFTVVRSGFEQTILQANGGNNTITVDRTTSALTILSNAGNDTVNVLDSTALVTVNTGSENASASAPFGDSISVNTDFAVSGDTAATVLVDESDSVLGLTVAPSGMLRIDQGGVLDKLVGTGSTFTLTGTLDLAGGSFLSRAGGPTPTDFRTQIIAGRNGGAWNGTSASGAINSSLAAGSAQSDGIGYGLGSETGISAIGPFAIAASDVLLRYTLDGDANLDQSVDISDLARLATNWQGATKVWTQGDSNYSNTVDISDLAALATNWQAASPLVNPFARTKITRVADTVEVKPADVLTSVSRT